MKILKSLSLSKQFLLSQIAIFVFLLLPFLFYIDKVMSNHSQAQLTENLDQINKIINGSFEVFFGQILDNTKNSLNIMENMLVKNYGPLTQNTITQSDNNVQIGDKQMPNILYNGISLAEATDIIDDFSEITESVATIFSKDSSGDFVRIATSLRDSNQKRVIGTTLGKEHPAYDTIKAQKIFYGKVRLFNKDYMSIYKPLIDTQNEVVGILFVAYNLENAYTQLKEKLSNIIIGKNGKIMVIDKKNDAFIFGGDNKPSENTFFPLLKAGNFEYEYDDKQYNFSEQSYSFYYYANDNRNNNKEKSVYYSVKLTSSATDESVPTITFPTDLQSAYLPNETIEFDIATASDSIDSRLQTVTAYRYLKDGESERSDVPAGKDVVASTTTTETLKYIVENYNSKDADKWYVKSKVANNVVTSEGWYVNKEKTQYTIDLADRPQGAEYIEILCYAVDDNGNVGFFNKIISIADATDDEMPVLYKVVNAPSATDNFTAPMTINLPTLYYTDDKVDYVHADVVVYKVNKENGSRQIMQSTGMSTKFDSIRGVYTVDAGIFNASTEGYYQVAVTISDSGNHRVTTYFNYNVKGGSIVEDPEIDNITSEAKEVAIDDSLYLTPPTVSVSDSETWGYLGLDENDDSNTSTYYTTTMVSASSNNYELDKYYFTGKAKGTYKLQYNVFLIRYNKTADFFDAEHHTTETATAGKMFINEKGQLCYKATQDNKCYYIYLEENESNGYDLKIHEDILGITGNSLETASPTEYTKLTENKDVEAFPLTSDIQTITVKDVIITVSIDDDAYAKTQYPEVGEKLDIVKPEVVVSGADKGNTIDKEESYVQISVTTGSTTQTLATINFAEWEEAVTNDSNFTVEGSNIKLNLSKNGRYTIKYSIQAQDYLGQNVGDAKTLEYTISNGDVTAPTIDFADDLFKEKYGLGEELVINLTGITVSDKVTTDVDKLLETIQIKLTNEDTDESWTLENSAEDGGYSYEHTFEEAGDYTLTISIKDEAGNTAEKSVSFTVTTDSADPINVQEVLGGVLIGVSVAILAGVVIYFVVSKVKLDKKEKGYKSENRDNKNKK